VRHAAWHAARLEPVRHLCVAGDIDHAEHDRLTGLELIASLELLERRGGHGEALQPLACRGAVVVQHEHNQAVHLNDRLQRV
tara:strand:- start:182 stop:427 length:246 start_codon:yes stop_codon:yes gene_type:complete